jgi:hypothetical protein
MPGCQGVDFRTNEAEADNLTARLYGLLPFAHLWALWNIAPCEKEWIPAEIWGEEGSAEINSDFFDVNKILSHFRRIQDSSVKMKARRKVGDLIKTLSGKDEVYAADDPDVPSVRILERYDSDSDEVSGDEDRQGCADWTPLNTIFWSDLILAANLQPVVTWSLQIVSQLQGIANCRS